MKLVLLALVALCSGQENESKGFAISLKSSLRRQLIVSKLVKFVSDEFMGRNFFILYDGTIDTSLAATELFGNSSTVFTIRYREGILNVLLRESTFGYVTSGVFTICSPQTTLQIFSEVSTYYLESSRLYWFVYFEKRVHPKLKDLLRTGTEVYILNGDAMDGEKISFYNIQWNTQQADNQLSTIGWWVWNLNHSDFSIQTPLVHSISEKNKNLNGKTLKASAINDFLFFFRVRYDDGTFGNWDGADYSALRQLSKIFNFKLEIVVPSIRSWGGPLPNGTITGMIGMVARHEVDMSINEISMSYIRETVIDFTNPYYTDYSALLSTAPGLASQAMLVIAPFQLESWLAVTLSVFLMITLIWIVELFITTNSPESKASRSKAFKPLHIWGSMMNQEFGEKPKESSLRILLAFWFLACVIFTSLYSSTLTAIFAAPRYEKAIDTLEDLLEALESGKALLSVPKGSNTHALIQYAETGLYAELNKYLRPESQSSTKKRCQQGLGKIVHVNTQLRNIVEAYIRCDYAIPSGKQEFFPNLYSIALPSGSPYRENFNLAIIQMTEAGLFKLWVEASSMRYLRKVGGKKGKYEGYVQRNRGQNSPLNLIQLQTAFFIIVSGWIGGFLTVLIEIMSIRITRRV